MTFFVDWALWVKMCFVLGVAITATIGAGLIKLVFDHRKLKKYAAMEQQKMEEQPMVEDFTVNQRRGRLATPFGVRALESGIEVEGVWISRNNSPMSSTPGSPMLSPQARGKAASRTSEVPSLSLPEQTHPYTNGTSTPSSSVGSFERATSAERLESPSSSSLKAGPRQKYRPNQPSALRFSTADQLEAGHAPVRSVSGSSGESSEDSFSRAPQRQSGYEQVRQPSYYQPRGVENAGPSTQPRGQPEYVQPGRSTRSSYAAQGYTHGVPDSHQPPPPQRYHQYSSSQSNMHDAYVSPQAPSNRSYVDLNQPAQHAPLLESIELTETPSMAEISPEKAKRTTRKLQKKAPPS